jgi:low affinity Fe/Cu permease
MSCRPASARAQLRVEPKFRSRLTCFMGRLFADLATAVAYQSGRPATFLIAAIVILAWAITGPIFHYSDTWQLIINTGTTIVTFLMVFVIQNTQNRDGAAIQAKLDELIRVSAARNALIGIETLTQEEIAEIRAKFAARAKNTAEGVKLRAKQKRTGRSRQSAVLDGEFLFRFVPRRPSAGRHRRSRSCSAAPTTTRRSRERSSSPNTRRFRRRERDALGRPGNAAAGLAVRRSQRKAL